MSMVNSVFTFGPGSGKGVKTFGPIIPSIPINPPADGHGCDAHPWSSGPGPGYLCVSCRFFTPHLLVFFFFFFFLLQFSMALLAAPTHFSASLYNVLNPADHVFVFLFVCFRTLKQVDSLIPF
jgi:hypothetical protein